VALAYDAVGVGDGGRFSGFGQNALHPANTKRNANLSGHLWRLNY